MPAAHPRTRLLTFHQRSRQDAQIVKSADPSCKRRAIALRETQNHQSAEQPRLSISPDRPIKRTLLIIAIYADPSVEFRALIEPIRGRTFIPSTAQQLKRVVRKMES